VDEEEKGSYILHSEVEKGNKEMRNKKATGDDVPGDVLRVLGENDLKIMKHMINTIYETGEWLKDFIEVTLQNSVTFAQSASHTYSKDSSKGT
jgi:hypothetical protein